MAQRRHHYERAFEWFLRSRRIPYVAVDEARKALIPGRVPRLSEPDGEGRGGGDAADALKSFDFVIYGDSGVNLLVDIKGRRVGNAGRKRGSASADGAVGTGVDHPELALGALLTREWRTSRLESWVTLEDIESLTEWERLFGDGFTAAFVFVYWCAAQPPDAVFQEIFEHQGVWYALRAVTVGDYRGGMKTRSARWGTVDLPRRVFEKISQPFAPSPGGGLLAGRAGADLGPEVPLLLPR